MVRQLHRLLPLIVFALVVPLSAQDTRSVEGVVTDLDGQVVTRAAVKLKDLKTLQVRSFLTTAEGRYYFHGLSREVDYEIKAESNGMASESKTLSVFDSRSTAVVNLQLTRKAR